MPLHALKQNGRHWHCKSAHETHKIQFRNNYGRMLDSVLFRGANKSTNIWNLEQEWEYFFIVYIIFRPTHLVGLAPIVTHSNSDAKTTYSLLTVSLHFIIKTIFILIHSPFILRDEKLFLISAKIIFASNTDLFNCLIKWPGKHYKNN